MLEGKWGVEGSMAKGLEEFVETVGPEAYNGVVLSRYIAELCRDGGREWDLKKIVADLCEPVREGVNPLQMEKDSR